MSRQRRERASSVAIAGAAGLATFALSLAAALLADPAAPLHAVPRLAVVAPPAEAWGTSWDALARPSADGLRAGLAVLIRLTGQIVAGAMVVAGLSLVLHALTRIVTRSDEFALRRVLGARSPHLLRLSLTDLLAAALPGCILGAAGGAACAGVLMARRPALLAPPEAGGNWVVVAVATLGVAVVLGLVAAGLIVAARGREAATHRHGDQVTASGGVLGMQAALAALQFAGLLAVAYVSVLVMRDAGRTGSGRRLPYPADAVTMAVRLRADADGDERRDAYAAVATSPSVLASPGAWLGLGHRVTATSVCGDCFVGGSLSPFNSAPVTVVAVSAESLTRMQVRLVAGRDIAAGDRPGASRAAVLSAIAAEALFPGADPVGQRLTLGPGDDGGYTVVGVAEPVAPGGLGSGGLALPMLYVSLLQHPLASIELTTRPGGLAAALGALRVARDRGVALAGVGAPEPLARRLDALAAPVAWLGTWLAILAAATALAAAVALAAGMGRIADARRREIAIRLALGAQPWAIVRWMLGKALRIAASGLVIGLTTARWLGDLLRRDVAGPVSSDLLDLLVVSLALATIAVVAGLTPAWRAASVDPATAWRGTR